MSDVKKICTDCRLMLRMCTDYRFITRSGIESENCIVIDSGNRHFSVGNPRSDSLLSCKKWIFQIESINIDCNDVKLRGLHEPIYSRQLLARGI